MKNKKLSPIAGILVVGALMAGYSTIVRAQYSGGSSANDQSGTNATTPKSPSTTDTGMQGSSTSGLSDRDLADKISKALKDDQTVSSYISHVKVKVSNGRVILKGNVKTEQAKDSIAAKAGEVAGTGNVENDIVVK